MTNAPPEVPLLDSPIWHALGSVHAPLARSHGLARRYPADVSPMAAVREPTQAAFDDLAVLVAPDDRVGLFAQSDVATPHGWVIEEAIDLLQMQCARLIPRAKPAPPIQELMTDDVADMLALTAATKPGPFLPRTISMGNYFGLRAEDGRLAAMAGERLQLDAFEEVSAVCVDPDFRGRGYAQALVAKVAAGALARGKTPFLHCTLDNPARHVYSSLGFTVRRQLRVNILTRG